MPKPDGSELKIELLRSEEWVLENWSPLFEPIDPMNFNSPRPASGRGVGGLGVRGPRMALLSRLLAPAPSLLPSLPLRPIFKEFVVASALAEDTDHEFLGATVHMDLHELAIEGPALITNIRSCPTVESGTGQVITATFHHSSGDVIDLVIGDEATNSPSGTKRVVNKLARPGPEPVFNLEELGEHGYYVGARGSLVHNSCEVAFGRVADGHLDDFSKNIGAKNYKRWEMEG